MFALLLALTLASVAAQLPGIPLSFDVDGAGAWVLPAELPPEFAAAGVQPGWVLTAVDGLELGQEPDAAERIVARGPARPVRLHFDTGQGITIVVVPRGPLVVLDEVGLLPWPGGFAPPARGWQAAGDAVPRLVDDGGKAWALDTATGAAAAVSTPADPQEIPPLWWSLAEAPWVVLQATGVRRLDAEAARADFGGAARLAGFQGRSGDHLALPEEGGLRVFSVRWPEGTPELGFCVPDVPETCLVTGRHVVATLLDRPGGRAEAHRALGIACAGGTYRACLEALALEDGSLAAQATACGERDVNACHAVVRQRLRAEPDDRSPVLVGSLEYACTVDASGSLGERLRRLEDVGEGCMLLAAAYDRLEVPDRALLSLDQACVLGRAEACTEATRRREEAFALKTIRECEDAALPLASACVQLGRLLEERDIAATERDAFGAYLRGCELGDEEGCVLLGNFVDRWGIANPRVVQAERTLLASCDKGEQRACVGAAHLLVRHEPRSEAYARALGLFRAACEAGVPSACIAGAKQRRIGSARQVDAPTPTEMWTRACDEGSAPGCAGLGQRLSRSKRTWAEAYAAWTKACDTGEASACTDLGRFVAEKHDPWPGEQPAPAYLRRGCENGDAAGCYYQAKDGLPRKGDPPEPAYVLLTRSCDGDFGQACADLGRVHLDRKTSFDDEIAAGHLQRACDNGQFESCKELGAMYQRGKGVEKDRIKARELAQRYSVNARRRHLRFGPRIGFPSVAGGEIELVAPIPVGPALAVTGSYSYLPGLGRLMVQLKGETYPDDPPDLEYVDAGLRLYPNNKARGLYGMVAAHRLAAAGGELEGVLLRTGFSARLGLHNEGKYTFTRVEMGLGQYGMIYLKDFDEDEKGSFPLVQATLAFTVGLSVL